MAKVVVVSGRSPSGSGRAQIRGVFTQKRKAWEVLEGSGTTLWDDVLGTRHPMTYNGMCRLLRKNGRVQVVEAGDPPTPLWLVVEAETNKLRGWDVSEEGETRANPVE